MPRECKSPVKTSVAVSHHSLCPQHFTIVFDWILSSQGFGSPLIYRWGVQCRFKLLLSRYRILTWMWILHLFFCAHFPSNLFGICLHANFKFEGLWWQVTKLSERFVLYSIVTEISLHCNAGFFLRGARSICMCSQHNAVTSTGQTKGIKTWLHTDSCCFNQVK